jgi:3',5'-cyclic AMP phosphodiesterase CpdA
MNLLSRRDFLRRAAALGILGLDAAAAPAPAGAPLRFAFVTDFHLMKDGAKRSAEGIAQCLAAVEALVPRADFILAGGDLVHDARALEIAEAERRLDQFLQLWRAHSSLPVEWTFGNHDLVGTSNDAANRADPRYGKGLFREKLALPHLFYSFDRGSWHFVVLDDISPQPGHTYIGELFADELAFLQADLAAHSAMPTLVCSHIPMASEFPMAAFFASLNQGKRKRDPRSLVCANADELFARLPAGHSVKALLAGHLHFEESTERGGIPCHTAGAVCGNYWTGPMAGCQEGFAVVDLGADGSVQFDYRGYGWKAA